MIRRCVLLATLPLALLFGCISGPPLATVEKVDLQRYAGKWYEIASYPAPFQRNCTGTTAEYTLRDDGTVQVFNRCLKGSLTGPEDTILGTARVVDAETNAKLAVNFGGFFEGPYWILMLDPDYQYAVVGEPTRSFLWILSRTPQMDDAVYEQILADLPALGYDPSRLNRTLQPTAD